MQVQHGSSSCAFLFIDHRGCVLISTKIGKKLINTVDNVIFYFHGCYTAIVFTVRTVFFIDIIAAIVHNTALSKGIIGKIYTIMILFLNTYWLFKCIVGYVLQWMILIIILGITV